MNTTVHGMCKEETIKYSNVNSLQIKQTRRHVREFVLSSGEQQREQETKSIASLQLGSLRIMYDFDVVA